MRDVTTAEHAAALMHTLHRRLRWIAWLVPVALLMMVSADGLSRTDLGVVVFVGVILWMFVFLTGFAADALERKGTQQD